MEEIDMAKKNSQQEVSVLAFEKKIVPSDGYLYGTTWEKRRENKRPLAVAEKSVRGTISNSLKDSVLGDPMKLSAEIQKANLQTVDCCFLSTEEDTLATNFTIKFLGSLDNPSACSNNEFLTKYRAILEDYKKEFGFNNLAFRYAYNIVCARFLWRNRLGAENIEVVVKDCKEGTSWTFDAKEYQLRKFDSSKEDELKELTSRIAAAFRGNDFALFEVECYAKIGNGQEVFPSEEMVLDKSKKEDKSKILYSANGCAAFHSQKIGNAIRTIDTWYKEYDTDTGVGPIAIDSYGPVTTLSKAFRAEKMTDFYSIKDAYVWENSITDPNDKHYFMAMIIRGGVFGESSKE